MATTDYLSASNGNGEAVTAVVTTDRPVGSTSLIVDSVLNWPAKGIATVGTLLTDGTLDPETVSVFKYMLSGSIIVIQDFAPSYEDIGNATDQVAVIKPTTEWADEVVGALDSVADAVLTTDTDLSADAFFLDEDNMASNSAVKVASQQSIKAYVGTQEALPSGVHGVTGSVVGTTDTQTLTGKTISGSSNTISNIGPDSRTGGYKVIIKTFSGTGSIAVTGVGFMPRGLVATLLTGSGPNIIVCSGGSDGSSEYCTWSVTNASTYSCGSDTSHCISSHNSTGVAQVVAKVASFDSDGATFTVSTNTGSANYITWALMFYA